MIRLISFSLRIFLLEHIKVNFISDIYFEYKLDVIYCRRIRKEAIHIHVRMFVCSLLEMTKDVRDHIKGVSLRCCMSGPRMRARIQAALLTYVVPRVGLSIHTLLFTRDYASIPKISTIVYTVSNYVEEIF